MIPRSSRFCFRSSACVYFTLALLCQACGDSVLKSHSLWSQARKEVRGQARPLAACVLAKNSHLPPVSTRLGTLSKVSSTSALFIFPSAQIEQRSAASRFLPCHSLEETIHERQRTKRRNHSCSSAEGFVAAAVLLCYCCCCCRRRSRRWNLRLVVELAYCSQPPLRSRLVCCVDLSFRLNAPEVFLGSKGHPSAGHSSVVGAATKTFLNQSPLGQATSSEATYSNH